MTSQELVSTLKEQHRILKSDLLTALNKTMVTANNTSNDVATYLNKFKNGLIKHLELENGFFYPDYMDKKINRGEDVISTKEFIRQMGEIVKVVMIFLEKYEKPQMIDNNLQSFKNELQNTIDTINIRFETEEDGVYGIYLLM